MPVMSKHNKWSPFGLFPGRSSVPLWWVYQSTKLWQRFWKALL